MARSLQGKQSPRQLYEQTKETEKPTLHFGGGGAAFRAGAFFSLASASQKTLKWGFTGRTLADFDLKSLLHSLDPRPGKGEYPNKCENPGGFFFALPGTWKRSSSFTNTFDPPPLLSTFH